MAQHAPGYITASTIAPFLTGKGDKLIKGGVTAAIKIAMERSDAVNVVNSVFEGNTYTEWGHEMEAEAIAKYEEVAFANVYDSQKGVVKRWTSCTPDGYIGKEGLVEVKCPYMEHTHMDYLLDPETLKAQYYDQVQFQLMLTGRKWCDLMSYHPHFAEGKDYVIVRIHPDAEWQAKCETRLAHAEEIINKTLNVLEQQSH